MQSKTIPDLLLKRAQLSPDAVAHWTQDKARNWTPTTWKEYWDASSRMAARLQSVGLKEGQKVGIMAHTSQTWEVMQMAVLISGGVVVGIDAHDRDENIHQIAQCAELAGIIIENSGSICKLSTQAINEMGFMISMEGPQPELAVRNFLLLEDLKDGEVRQREGAEEIKAKNELPATIIFTSGTTGAPKGIEYTHEQLLLACSAILEVFREFGPGNNLVCWLPLSNLFQRVVNFCAMHIEAATYFVEDPRDVVQQLQSIHPHLFIGVPRFFEKLHQGILEEISRRPLLIQKAIHWAIRIGDVRARAAREKRAPGLFSGIAHYAAERLILHRLKGILGKNLKCMISGSAPMPRWLLEWYHALGVVILEAYGISENVVPVSMNGLSAYKFGTVGKPLEGNSVVIAKDGELLVKGRGVCSGYYRGDPRMTPLTADGYLATGDFAKIDEDGFITLTGRKSDIFKTSTGRRIAPVGIENCLLRVPYIEHAFIIGAQRKFLIALLSVSYPALLKLAGKSESAASGGNSPMPDVLCERIRLDMLHETDILPEYQRPAGILVVTRSFTVQGGELTSNLKVRRKIVEQKYREEIERLYAILEKPPKSEELIVRSI